MRNLIIVFLIFIVFQGCKTYSYFNTSNDLSNEFCQVFLVDGSEIDGKLTIQFETGHDMEKYLKIKSDSNAERKILVTDVQYYKYKNEYYFPKETNLEAYEIPNRDKVYTPNVNNLLFMKRMTKADAKIQLFQLFKSRNNSLEASDQYDYYISFNNENRWIAWSIRGNKFFPNFEEKMSKIVFNCPTLADKIQHKMNGYAARQLSVDAKKYEVIKKIVEEFNNCN